MDAKVEKISEKADDYRDVGDRLCRDAYMDVGGRVASGTKTEHRVEELFQVKKAIARS